MRQAMMQGHSRADTELRADTDAPASNQRAADPRIGTSLAHFRIEALLGRGGMGAVYRGWDEALARPVAVKVLTAEHPQARTRFLREARAQAKVRHPNVVPIHFVGEQDDVVFLSMDLVEGASVAELLREGRMSIDAALDIVDAVAEALAEGQKSGLVHRDVKPSNLLRTQGGRVLLADFGLAKAVGAAEAGEAGAPELDEPALTQRGAIVGTPAYMAPEQARAGTLDHRADMYALGVTLYEMVTGQLPFTAPDSATLLQQHREEEPLPARMLAPELPPEVDALITRLMRKDPAARFESFAELRRAVAEARRRPAPSAGFFARAGAMTVDTLGTALVAVIVSFGYEAAIWPVTALLLGISEARWGRTVGKRLFALRVVDRHGAPPKPVPALARNVAKLWAPITAGVLGAVFEEAAWVNWVIAAVVLVWGASFAMAAGGRKLGVHDRVSGTRVVYDLDAPATR